MKRPKSISEANERTHTLALTDWDWGSIQSALTDARNNYGSGYMSEHLSADICERQIARLWDLAAKIDPIRRAAEVDFWYGAGYADAYRGQEPDASNDLQVDLAKQYRAGYRAGNVARTDELLAKLDKEA